jgi:hypothetical protein
MGQEHPSFSQIEIEDVKKTFDPDDLLIRISDDIQEPFPLFSILFKIIGSPGNLLVIKAKQKAGKTFLICVFAAAYYRKQFLSVKATPTPGKKFYWLDSEQSKSQVYKVLKRMHRMAGFLPFTEQGQDVGIFYLSELTIEERWKILETLAAREVCEVLAVDVVTDFLNDPNDLRETKAAADKLQAIAKKHNIIIICTIHENKDNDNATGHIGSALMKKGETVLSLEKRNQVFTVKSPYARHGDVEEFSFTIDADGLPIEADSPLMMTKSEKLDIDIRQRFKKILAVKRLSHKELVEAYEDQSGLSQRAARNHITIALNDEIIEVSDRLYGLKIISHEREE